VAVRGDWVRDAPHLVRRIVRWHMKAMRWVLENPSEAEELIAKTALEEAEAYLGTDKKVDHHILIAEQEFANAEEKLARGQPDKAIDHYRKAWEHAQLALYLANK